MWIIVTLKMTDSVIGIFNLSIRKRNIAKNSSGDIPVRQIIMT